MILKNLVHNNIGRRILTSVVFFYLLFFSTVILSYLLLPEGFLKGKNSILDFKTSLNVWIQAFQIFAFNCISVLLLILANLFAGEKHDGFYLPYGYLGLGVQLLLNGITLGTWSFTTVSESAPSLADRLLRTFDIFHRAGLWEMTGQLLIVTATAGIALVRIKGKTAEAGKPADSGLSLKEVLTALTGLLFMVLGAVIESFAILSESV